MGLEVPNGEPQPPPAMSKARYENCCLDWDAERGIHGCQSSNIQLRRDQGLGESVILGTAAQDSKPCIYFLCLQLQVSASPEAPSEGHV